MLKEAKQLDKFVHGWKTWHSNKPSVVLQHTIKNVFQLIVFISNTVAEEIDG